MFNNPEKTKVRNIKDQNGSTLYYLIFFKQTKYLLIKVSEQRGRRKVWEDSWKVDLFQAKPTYHQWFMKMPIVWRKEGGERDRYKGGEEWGGENDERIGEKSRTVNQGPAKTDR